MEIPGRCSSCLRGGRSLVIAIALARQCHTPGALPKYPGTEGPGSGRAWSRCGRQRIDIRRVGRSALRVQNIVREDRCVTGHVENAVRGSVAPGELLATPTGRGRFKVARYTSEGLVLLLGAKEAWTRLPWQAVEGVPDLLRGRGWVAVGSLYSTDSQPGSLDEYLKSFLKRATAGWVAVVLERAGVLVLDRSRPARVKLRPGW